MAIKKKGISEAKPKAKASLVKKVAAIPAKKTISAKNKGIKEPESIPEMKIVTPKELKIKVEAWQKIQTAEGWRRERRKEKIMGKKG